MKIVITGGAGFIGSALCRLIIESTDHTVVNIDKLTYSSNLHSLDTVAHSERYSFFQEDICNTQAIAQIFEREKPDGVIHLAAESHVDRSITGSGQFITTNIVGTHTLLECARRHWETLAPASRDSFRFVHVSTDEVFGSLESEGTFDESTPYDPSSPYSASKAASDHLVRAWHRTYKLPVIVSNCSNNFGTHQFPEKLIPLIITNGILGRNLPVYGTGGNVRDWLFVDDHARALMRILEAGLPGQSYAVGSRNERTNLQVVQAICDLLDRYLPRFDGSSFSSMISFVTDRPGHDQRYAIDPAKIEADLGWSAQEPFVSGLDKTVQWYLANQAWWMPLRDRHYDGERLGLLGY